MGIPYYFYNLTQKYKNIILTELNFIPDIYCLDFNGIIHPVAQDVLKTDETNKDTIELNIIEKLKEKITYYLTTINPTKLVICVDGTVPIAKMIQQRKRRYLTVLKNKLENTNIKWDTNAITPNTSFMKKLNKSLKQFIKGNKSIVYSGSDIEGEGEHKIFVYLNNINDKSILINGLDADLVILSLMSHKKDIYLMREMETNTIVSINNLREAIIKELSSKWDKNIGNDYYCDDAKDIIESYCVMCSLLGNDFIPHLLTLNLKTNGLEKCINYTTNSIKNHGILVSNCNINYECLSNIIQLIAKTEDTDIFNETEKYIKKNYSNSSNTDYYALKNKDIVANLIYSDISTWRHIYYKYIFDTNIYLDTSTIRLACDNYIKGIYWTYNYYKKTNIDNEWYYPYIYPPSVKDIANYTIGNNAPIIVNKELDIDPNIQLLIVLPLQSISLIPPKYKKYMTDNSKGLKHLYPIDYKIHTYLKTHLWECSPKLPIINLKYIKDIVII